MRIGIVGSEGAKFTTETEQLARQAIRNLLSPGDVVVSGKCHLGGIDIWAVEEGTKLGLECVEYPPHVLAWPGYQARNLKIARDSDLVVCLTVKEFPPDYQGMRFPYCYHCKTDQHIKSGGCWTVKQAKLMGKEGRIVVITQT